MPKREIENFVKVAEYIFQNSHCEIVLLGLYNNQKYSNKFKSLFKQPVIIDLISKTSLIDVIKILSGVKFLLGNDSGIAHISAAVGTSTLVLLNGTHFGRFFPHPIGTRLDVNSIYPIQIESSINEFCYLYDKYKNRLTLVFNIIKAETVIS